VLCYLHATGITLVGDVTGLRLNAARRWRSRLTVANTVVRDAAKTIATYNATGVRDALLFCRSVYLRLDLLLANAAERRRVNSAGNTQHRACLHGR